MAKTIVVHCKRERYDVYIGRPGFWGNPFRIGQDGSRASVIARYREWLKRRPWLVERMKGELKGKVLGCWCKPHACHGDVIAEVIDGKDDSTGEEGSEAKRRPTPARA